MTQLWSATSLLALGLLGCLTWTNVEAQRKVSPSATKSEIQMSYTLGGILLLLCTLSILFSSTLTYSSLDKTLNHRTQHHHTLVNHMTNRTGPRNHQIHLKSQLVTCQHLAESRVESRPFLWMDVRLSAAAMTAYSAILEAQVGFPLLPQTYWKYWWKVYEQN